MKRRTFLKTAAASLAVPYFVPRHVLAAPGRPGANDRIRGWCHRHGWPDCLCHQ